MEQLECVWAQGAVDLDLLKRDQVSKFAELSPTNVQVKLQRRAVRMDGHDCHLASLFGEMEAVRDELWLGRLDELDELVDPCFEFVQPALMYVGAIDVNNQALRSRAKHISAYASCARDFRPHMISLDPTWVTKKWRANRSGNDETSFGEW
jgi:hypothetical protein